jgi:Tol biopolymer transport system component
MLRRGLLAVSLIALATSVASAAPDARNGQLLYLRPLGGNNPPFGRLFVAAPDGSGARDITPAGIKDVQGAAWSPDGRRIAISAIADNDHDPEIFILAADGRVIRQATNNHLSDRHPTWSPDGRRIAFASIRTGLRQIYGMRADGSRQRRLSHQNEDCEDPAWSPNGRWIVFTCQLGYWKLIRMRPDGSGERRLLPGYPLTETDPSWTPDGRIVFSRGAPTPRGRGIFITGANGKGLRRLRAHGGDPFVSPDGRLIAFAWTPDGANQELFVMRSNGTGVRQITATNGVLEWNADWQRASSR